MKGLNITKEFVLLLIVAVLLIVNLVNMNNIKTDVKFYEDRIKSLQLNVDSLTKINGNIDDRISNVNSEINSINTKIEKIDKNIKIIKNNTDEKVDNVDNFGINELELFFSTRYGKK